MKRPFGIRNLHAQTLVAVVVVLATATGIGLAVLAAARDAGQAFASEPAPSAPISHGASQSASALPSPAPSVSREPSPPAPPTPTADPTSTPRPSGAAQVAWTPAAPRDGRVSAVIHAGGAWIAGGAVDDGTTSRAAIWRSTDGITWTDAIVLPPDPVVSEGFMPRYWINGFGTWDGAILAYGWNGVGCCDGGYPILWRSVDGQTWSEVDTSGTTYGERYHFPESSISTDDGRIVVLSTTGLGGGASIFTTADLVSWTEHAVTGSDPTFQFRRFAASPQGWLAVGSYTAGWTDRPRPEQRLWSSTDGVTWTAIEPPAPLGALQDIAWDEARGRFVVVGFDERDLPAVWLTQDGRSWSRTTLSDTPGSADSISIHDGLLVVGGHEDGAMESIGTTLAWTSHDGVTWRVIPLGEGARPIAGASAAGAVMLIDGWGDPRDSQWAAWAGTVDD